MTSARIAGIGSAAGTAVALAFAAMTVLAETPRPDAATALAKRGEYLVTIAGCNDCHTPMVSGPDGPERDTARMLSGHPEQLVMPPLAARPESPWETIASATFTAWSGPWGVSYTANLTPDVETGLGRWTLQNFKDTIRTGRHLGRGREILPPMPIPMYRHLNDQDLEAIFAYLQSIPAVKNRVPEPLPPPATLAVQ